MSNKGYCRFENTLGDLEDCYDHLEDSLSRDEHEARAELISLCRTIVREAKSMDLKCEDDEEIDYEEEVEDE